MIAIFCVLVLCCGYDLIYYQELCAVKTDKCYKHYITANLRHITIPHTVRYTHIFVFRHRLQSYVTRDSYSRGSTFVACSLRACSGKSYYFLTLKATGKMFSHFSVIKANI